MQQIPGTGTPRYPDMLRSAGVEGEVLAQFVVTRRGRAENGTFKVLKSTHDLFTQRCARRCRRCGSIPAEVGGKKVKQLVQQPFQFKLDR